MYGTWYNGSLALMHIWGNLGEMYKTGNGKLCNWFMGMYFDENISVITVHYIIIQQNKWFNIDLFKKVIYPTLNFSIMCAICLL